MSMSQQDDLDDMNDVDVPIGSSSEGMFQKDEGMLEKNDSNLLIFRGNSNNRNLIDESNRTSNNNNRNSNSSSRISKKNRRNFCQKICRCLECRWCCGKNLRIAVKKSIKVGFRERGCAGVVWPVFCALMFAGLANWISLSYKKGTRNQRDWWLERIDRLKSQIVRIRSTDKVSWDKDVMLQQASWHATSFLTKGSYIEDHATDDPITVEDATSDTTMGANTSRHSNSHYHGHSSEKDETSNEYGTDNEYETSNEYGTSNSEDFDRDMGTDDDSNVSVVDGVKRYLIKRKNLDKIIDRYATEPNYNLFRVYFGGDEQSLSNESSETSPSPPPKFGTPGFKATRNLLAGITMISNKDSKDTVGKDTGDTGEDNPRIISAFTNPGYEYELNKELNKEAKMIMEDPYVVDGTEHGTKIQNLAGARLYSLEGTTSEGLDRNTRYTNYYLDQLGGFSNDLLEKRSYRTRFMGSDKSLDDNKGRGHHDKGRGYYHQGHHSSKYDSEYDSDKSPNNDESLEYDSTTDHPTKVKKNYGFDLQMLPQLKDQPECQEINSRGWNYFRQLLFAPIIHQESDYKSGKLVEDGNDGASDYTSGGKKPGFETGFDEKKPVVEDVIGKDGKPVPKMKNPLPITKIKRSDSDYVDQVAQKIVDFPDNIVLKDRAISRDSSESPDIFFDFTYSAAYLLWKRQHFLLSWRMYVSGLVEKLNSLKKRQDMLFEDIEKDKDTIAKDILHIERLLLEAPTRLSEYISSSAVRAASGLPTQTYYERGPIHELDRNDSRYVAETRINPSTAAGSSHNVASHLIPDTDALDLRVLSLKIVFPAFLLPYRQAVDRTGIHDSSPEFSGRGRESESRERQPVKRDEGERASESRLMKQLKTTTGLSRRIWSDCVDETKDMPSNLIKWWIPHIVPKGSTGSAAVNDMGSKFSSHLLKFLNELNTNPEKCSETNGIQVSPRKYFQGLLDRNKRRHRQKPTGQDSHSRRITPGSRFYEKGSTTSFNEALNEKSSKKTSMRGKSSRVGRAVSANIESSDLESNKIVSSDLESATNYAFSYPRDSLSSPRGGNVKTRNDSFSLFDRDYYTGGGLSEGQIFRGVVDPAGRYRGGHEDVWDIALFRVWKKVVEHVAENQRRHGKEIIRNLKYQGNSFQCCGDKSDHRYAKEDFDLAETSDPDLWGWIDHTARYNGVSQNWRGSLDESFINRYGFSEKTGLLKFYGLVCTTCLAVFIPLCQIPSWVSPYVFAERESSMISLTRIYGLDKKDYWLSHFLYVFYVFGIALFLIWVSMFSTQFEQYLQDSRDHALDWIDQQNAQQNSTSTDDGTSGHPRRIHNIIHSPRTPFAVDTFIHPYTSILFPFLILPITFSAFTVFSFWVGFTGMKLEQVGNMVARLSIMYLLLICGNGTIDWFLECRGSPVRHCWTVFHDVIRGIALNIEGGFGLIEDLTKNDIGTVSLAKTDFDDLNTKGVDLTLRIGVETTKTDNKNKNDNNSSDHNNKNDNENDNKNSDKDKNDENQNDIAEHFCEPAGMTGTSVGNAFVNIPLGLLIPGWSAVRLLYMPQMMTGATYNMVLYRNKMFFTYGKNRMSDPEALVDERFGSSGRSIRSSGGFQSSEGSTARGSQISFYDWFAYPDYDQDLKGEKLKTTPTGDPTGGIPMAGSVDGDHHSPAGHAAVKKDVTVSTAVSAAGNPAGPAKKSRSRAKNRSFLKDKSFLQDRAAKPSSSASRIQCDSVKNGFLQEFQSVRIGETEHQSVRQSVGDNVRHALADEENLRQTQSEPLRLPSSRSPYGQDLYATSDKMRARDREFQFVEKKFYDYKSTASSEVFANILNERIYREGNIWSICAFGVTPREFDPILAKNSQDSALHHALHYVLMILNLVLWLCMLYRAEKCWDGMYRGESEEDVYSHGVDGYNHTPIGPPGGLPRLVAITNVELPTRESAAQAEAAQTRPPIKEGNLAVHNDGNFAVHNDYQKQHPSLSPLYIGASAPVLSDSLSSVHSSGVRSSIIHSGVSAPRDSEGRSLYALQVQGLTKRYAKNGPLANNNLNFEVMRGEIFGLLGHNGAGKSTLVFQLMGILPVTKGDAVINGKSLRTDGVDIVRQELTVCPQESPFWDTFTVQEHVEFFAKLRGLDDDACILSSDDEDYDADYDGNQDAQDDDYGNRDGHDHVPYHPMASIEEGTAENVRLKKAAEDGTLDDNNTLDDAGNSPSSPSNVGNSNASVVVPLVITNKPMSNTKSGSMLAQQSTVIAAVPDKFAVSVDQLVGSTIQNAPVSEGVGLALENSPGLAKKQSASRNQIVTNLSAANSSAGNRPGGDASNARVSGISNRTLSPKHESAEGMIMSSTHVPGAASTTGPAGTKQLGSGRSGRSSISAVEALGRLSSAGEYDNIIRKSHNARKSQKGRRSKRLERTPTGELKMGLHTGGRGVIQEGEGLIPRNMRDQIRFYLDALGLLDKLHTQCRNLSAGEKRRVWIVCALLGDSSLMLLDEPTSGLSPPTRRDFWKLVKIIAKEQNRAVVFSTHYLEEADLLAERKVILADGRVRAIGTSSELKREWGKGYWITVFSNRQQRELDHPELDPTELGSKVADLLQRCGNEVVGPAMHLENPELELETNHVTDYERSFCVPWNLTDYVADCIEAIQFYKAEYLIDDIHVQPTSLDEVFERIGRLADQERMIGEKQREMEERNGEYGFIGVESLGAVIGGDTLQGNGAVGGLENIGGIVTAGGTIAGCADKPGFPSKPNNSILATNSGANNMLAINNSLNTGSGAPAMNNDVGDNGSIDLKTHTRFSELLREAEETRQQDFLIGRLPLNKSRRRYSCMGQMVALLQFRYYADFVNEKEHTCSMAFLVVVCFQIGLFFGKALCSSFYDIAIVIIYMCSGFAIIGARLGKEKEWGVLIHMQMHGLNLVAYHIANFLFYWIAFCLPCWLFFFCGLCIGNFYLTENITAQASSRLLFTAMLPNRSTSPGGFAGSVGGHGFVLPPWGPGSSRSGWEPLSNMKGPAFSSSEDGGSLSSGDGAGLFSSKEDVASPPSDDLPSGSGSLSSDDGSGSEGNHPPSIELPFIYLPSPEASHGPIAIKNGLYAHDNGATANGIAKRAFNSEEVPLLLWIILVASVNCILFTQVMYGFCDNPSMVGVILVPPFFHYLSYWSQAFVVIGSWSQNARNNLLVGKHEADGVSFEDVYSNELEFTPVSSSFLGETKSSSLLDVVSSSSFLGLETTNAPSVPSTMTSFLDTFGSLGSSLSSNLSSAVEDAFETSFRSTSVSTFLSTLTTSFLQSSASDHVSFLESSADDESIEDAENDEWTPGRDKTPNLLAVMPKQFGLTLAFRSVIGSQQGLQIAFIQGLLRFYHFRRPFEIISVLILMLWPSSAAGLFFEHLNVFRYFSELCSGEPHRVSLWEKDEKGKPTAKLRSFLSCHESINYPMPDPKFVEVFASKLGELALKLDKPVLDKSFSDKSKKNEGNDESKWDDDGNEKTWPEIERSYWTGYAAVEEWFPGGVQKPAAKEGTYTTGNLWGSVFRLGPARTGFAPIHFPLDTDHLTFGRIRVKKEAADSIEAQRRYYSNFWLNGGEFLPRTTFDPDYEEPNADGSKPKGKAFPLHDVGKQEVQKYFMEKFQLKGVSGMRDYIVSNIRGRDDSDPSCDYDETLEIRKCKYTPRLINGIITTGAPDQIPLDEVECRLLGYSPAMVQTKVPHAIQEATGDATGEAKHTGHCGDARTFLMSYKRNGVFVESPDAVRRRLLKYGDALLERWDDVFPYKMWNSYFDVYLFIALIWPNIILPIMLCLLLHAAAYFVFSKRVKKQPYNEDELPEQEEFRDPDVVAEEELIMQREKAFAKDNDEQQKMGGVYAGDKFDLNSVSGYMGGVNCSSTLDIENLGAAQGAPQLTSFGQQVNAVDVIDVYKKFSPARLGCCDKQGCCGPEGCCFGGPCSECCNRGYCKPGWCVFPGICCNSATKEFRKRKKDSVLWVSKGISLGVPNGECFGLLGVCGAGKSTLFDMITGNSDVGGPTKGNIRIHGKDVADDQFHTARTTTGIVPQFDRLWPTGSGRQHLRLYAKLCGTYWPSNIRQSGKHDVEHDSDSITFGDGEAHRISALDFGVAYDGGKANRDGLTMGAGLGRGMGEKGQTQQAQISQQEGAMITMKAKQRSPKGKPRGESPSSDDVKTGISPSSDDSSAVAALPINIMHVGASDTIFEESENAVSSLPSHTGAPARPSAAMSSATSSDEIQPTFSVDMQNLTSPSEMGRLSTLQTKGSPGSPLSSGNILGSFGNVQAPRDTMESRYNDGSEFQSSPHNSPTHQALSVVPTNQGYQRASNLSYQTSNLGYQGPNLSCKLSLSKGSDASYGLHPDHGEARIARFLREVGISDIDADRNTEEYSPGMKRKLAVALTLITDPQICFLDEMSRGVDIVSQRNLWKKLINRPVGQTILMTTHSMVEADAVADRVGILVAGRLQCLGNTSHIKAIYGDGYHLEIKVDLTKILAYNYHVLHTAAKSCGCDVSADGALSMKSSDGVSLSLTRRRLSDTRLSTTWSPQFSIPSGELQNVMMMKNSTIPAWELQNMMRSKNSNSAGSQLQNQQQGSAGVNDLSKQQRGSAAMSSIGNSLVNDSGVYASVSAGNVGNGMSSGLLTSANAGNSANATAVYTRENEGNSGPSASANASNNGPHASANAEEFVDPMVQAALCYIQMKSELEEAALMSGISQPASGGVTSSASPGVGGSQSGSGGTQQISGGSGGQQGSSVGRQQIVLQTDPSRTQCVHQLTQITNNLIDASNIEFKIMDHIAVSCNISRSQIFTLEKVPFSPTKLFLVIALGSGANVQDIQKGEKTRDKIPLSPIFRWCTRDPFDIIEDYSLGEPTLEQVFLKFATDQELQEKRREAELLLLAGETPDITAIQQTTNQYVTCQALGFKGPQGPMPYSRGGAAPKSINSSGSFGDSADRSESTKRLGSEGVIGTSGASMEKRGTFSERDGSRRLGSERKEVSTRSGSIREGSTRQIGSGSLGSQFQTARANGSQFQTPTTGRSQQSQTPAMNGSQFQTTLPAQRNQGNQAQTVGPQTGPGNSMAGPGNPMAGAENPMAHLYATTDLGKVNVDPKNVDPNMLQQNVDPKRQNVHINLDGDNNQPYGNNELYGENASHIPAVSYSTPENTATGGSTIAEYPSQMQQSRQSTGAGQQGSTSEKHTGRTDLTKTFALNKNHQIAAPGQALGLGQPGGQQLPTGGALEGQDVPLAGLNPGGHLGHLLHFSPQDKLQKPNFLADMVGQPGGNGSQHGSLASMQSGMESRVQAGTKYPLGRSRVLQAIPEKAMRLDVPETHLAYAPPQPGMFVSTSIPRRSQPFQSSMRGSQQASMQGSQVSGRVSQQVQQGSSGGQQIGGGSGAGQPQKRGVSNVMQQAPPDRTQQTVRSTPAIHTASMGPIDNNDTTDESVRKMKFGSSR